MDPKDKEKKERQAEDRRADKLMKSIRPPKAKGGDFDMQMNGGRGKPRKRTYA